VNRHAHRSRFLAGLQAVEQVAVAVIVPAKRDKDCGKF
jgi:hypothetical protein